MVRQGWPLGLHRLPRREHRLPRKWAYIDCPDESLHGLPRKWAYMDCPEKRFFMELIPIEPNDAKKKI